MMTDNEGDERREVAARLRELRHRTYYREEIVESICDAISIADPVNTFREPEDVYELLTDLMDPVCHRVLEDETQVCSECGWDLDERYGWNYCPCCGARITEVS